MNPKTFTLVAVLLTSSVTALHAESPTPDPYQGGLGTRIRAEVIAELKAAQRDGSMVALTGEDSGSVHLAQQQTQSRVTRAQVRAELVLAQAQGLQDTLTGEDSGSFYFAGLWRAGDQQRYAQLVG